MHGIGILLDQGEEDGPCLNTGCLVPQHGLDDQVVEVMCDVLLNYAETAGVGSGEDMSALGSAIRTLTCGCGESLESCFGFGDSAG